MTQVFTFDTAHHALWAEEIAGEAGIPVEVIPAPAGATARCNLALQTLSEDEPRLQAVLTDAGVPYGVYGEAGA